MIATPLTRAAAAAGIMALIACGPPDGRTEDASTEAPRSGAPTMSAATPQDTGWIDLVDGSDHSAWRGYRREELPAGWRARDGMLGFVPGVEGGDIVTREEYGDFEFELEWRVGPAGNSGIFYRATEERDVIWESAVEMQVLDDEGHVDGGTPATSAGAAYALYPPTADVVKPAGEWNRVRIVALGPHVEHWLNGEKVVEYEAWSEDWNRRVAASKFAEFPGFGEARRGHIGLQDHGDEVWYRNIRIRRLGTGAP